MITRTTDASFLNRVINDPEVSRHLPFYRNPVDLTAVVSNQNNVTLVGDHGGMIFIEVIPGVFEIHTQVMPEGRGEWALQMARSAVDYVFCRTRAVEVFTRVPKGNVGAMALARACGAKPEKTLVQDFAGEELELDIYGGRMQDWLNSASAQPILAARGEAFHVKLEAKKAAMGLNLPGHPEDRWHNVNVGAAYGMIEGGQVLKGILTYNRWAAMALAPPMRVISENPLILDITEVRLEVRGDDFDVIPVTEH